MTIEASSDRSQDQMQNQASQRSPERWWFATKANGFTAAALSRMECSSHATSRKTNTVPSVAAIGAGRPSAGGRLTTNCPQGKESASLRRCAQAGWPRKATTAVARSSRAPRQASHASSARHRGPSSTVRPNPSLERGPPPASRLARAPSSVIIRRAGQPPSRLRPLSSNVRPQDKLGRALLPAHDYL